MVVVVVVVVVGVVVVVVVVGVVGVVELQTCIVANGVSIAPVAASLPKLGST